VLYMYVIDVITYDVLMMCTIIDDVLMMCTIIDDQRSWGTNQTRENVHELASVQRFDAITHRACLKFSSSLNYAWDPVLYFFFTLFSDL
jgi:hypothetical protein